MSNVRCLVRIDGRVFDDNLVNATTFTGGRRITLQQGTHITRAIKIDVHVSVWCRFSEGHAFYLTKCFHQFLGYDSWGLTKGSSQLEGHRDG